MKRVLLTGASGFIGRHAIAPLTSRGYEVHVADIREPFESNAKVCFHSTDLMDGASIRKTVAAVRPTALLHFAWYVEPGKFWTSAANVKWLQSSVELLTAFVESGGKRALTAGTCAEYDWNGDGICQEATSPIRPATLYGTAKNCVREMQDALMRQAGGESVWARIFHVYGPYEASSRFLPHVITSFLAGEEALCSSGIQVRDFMHAEDVASAFVHVLDSSYCGPINIGSGERVTLAEVAETVAAEMSAVDLLRLGALPQSPGDPDRLVPDVSLLNRLGFRPNRVLSDGLRETIAWWRAHLAR